MISRLVGWFFEQIMSGPVGRFRQDTMRPFAAQAASLKAILETNRDTEFGRSHDFARLLKAPGDLWLNYRKTVPIRSYADFQPDIERMKAGGADILVPGRPEMFSLTSGTTAEPKSCPVTRAFIKEHHRQHLLWMYGVYSSHPAANGGKYLVVASPAEMGRTSGGIPFGAMSGKQLDVQSIPVRRRMAAPALVQRLENPEDRWFNFILFALAEENLKVVTAVNPSSLVAIAQRLERHGERLVDYVSNGIPDSGTQGAGAAKQLASLFRANPARGSRLGEILKTDGFLTPTAVWPNLAVLLTWQGGSSAFYMPQVEASWGRTPRRCLGLRASEGTFSIPKDDNEPFGTLAVGGHAMEFIPAEDGDPAPDQPTLLAGELENDRLYRLVVTTSGGFYRYDLADLVRVAGFDRNTPRIAFERRAGSVLSATGEKVTEDQVMGAMAAAIAEGPILAGFTVTWEMEDGYARYVLAVETAGGSGAPMRRGGAIIRRLANLTADFDAELRRRNVEYDGKRSDHRLLKPRMLILEPGSYDSYRIAAARDGRPESQVKQPILVSPARPGKAPLDGCAFFDNVRIAMELNQEQENPCR